MKKVDLGSYLYVWGALCTLLFFIGFSLDPQFIPDISSLFSETLATFYAMIGEALGFSENSTYVLISDSTGTLLHIIIVPIVSAYPSYYMCVLLKDKTSLVVQIARRVMTYLLIYVLIVYGLNKLFKWQFYMPEPNILYTAVGNLEKDILYWTSMGASYTYTVFAGVLELLAAMFLMFRKTRMLGLLMSTGIFLNVVMINFGFDISVKLLSSVLLLISLGLLIPYLPNLVSFDRLNALKKYQDCNIPIRNKSYAKLAILLVFLMEGMYPYINTGNYNDDTAERPEMHGAYIVDGHIIDGIEYTGDYSNPWVWKRVFIHRDNYLIVQHSDDSMEDYKLDFDAQSNEMLLESNSMTYQLSYEIMPEGLVLRGNIQNKEVEIIMSTLNWRALPIFTNQFHLTIDQIGLK